MKTVWHNIKKFCSTIWGILRLVREGIANLLLIFLVIGSMFLLFKYYQYSNPKIPLNYHRQQHQQLKNNKSSPRVLVLDMSAFVKYILPDPIIPQKDQFKKLNFIDKLLVKKIIAWMESLKYSDKVSLFEVVDAIHRATYDPTISSIVLNLSHFKNESDLTMLDYVGHALQEFKASGKSVYSISKNYPQNVYYLASFANKVYLHPKGFVELSGMLTNEIYYYKDFLDKLGISPYIVKVGKYKAAVEPILLNEMSSAARADRESLAKDLWDHYLQTVAKNRHITVQQLFPAPKEILNKLKELKYDFTKYAIQNNLVDKLTTENDFNDEIIQQFGGNKILHKFNQININNYIENIHQEKTVTHHDNFKKPLQKRETGNTVGVIKIDGELSSGYSKYIIDLIQEATQSPRYMGFVVYDDSPGGLVEPSENIRNSFQTLRNRGKPVVTYMGQYAASGGYLITTTTDYIIANPYTITGSIGIFGVIPNFKLLLDKLGIHQIVLNKSPVSTATVIRKAPLFRSLTPQEQDVFKTHIKMEYDNFIYKVAEARHRSIQYINSIGEGRVWSGSQAQKIGLVDQIGNFDDAINKVIELAHKDNNKNIYIEWLNPYDPYLALLYNLNAFFSDSSDDDDDSLSMAIIKKELLQPIYKVISQNPNLIKVLNPYLSIFLESLKSKNMPIYAECLECVSN
ncbi:MAG: signal peptide peptidase SppA [Candidatus Dasytiphilus stammeri]